MSQLTLKCAKFCLSRGLDDLLSSGDLVDVTLSCQGEFIQAHKTVLAACSAHFRSIFKLQPWQHPVVFMHDLDLAQLKALINFMYNGEVTIEETDLPDFLKLADALKVSGLTLKEKETAIPLPEVQNMISNPVAPSSPTPPPAKKRRRSQDGDVSRLAPSPVVPPAAPTNEDSTPQVNIKLEEEEVADLLSQFQDDPLNNQECKAEELADLSDNDLIDAQVCLADDEDDLQLDESTQEDDSWFETGPSTSQQSSCVPNIDVQSSRQQPVATAVSSRGRRLCPTQIAVLSAASKKKQRSKSPTVKGKYYCKPCEKNLRGIDTFKCHLKSNKHIKNIEHLKNYKEPEFTSEHQSEATFICKRCPRKYKSLQYLSHHIKVSHSLCCLECNKKFESESKLRQHNIIHHFDSDQLYKCKLCKLGFARATHLRDHLTGVHELSSLRGNMSARCEYCLEMFESSRTKLTHIQQVHPEKVFVCRLCPKICVAKDERLRHEINVHRVNLDNPDKFFTCNVCDKPFVSQKFLVRHNKAVHSEVEINGN